MGKRQLRWLSIGIVMLLLIGLGATVGIAGEPEVNIDSGGTLSLETQVSLVAQQGETEVVEPTYGKGGLPIRSVSYNEDGYILKVEFNWLEPIVIAESDIEDWSSVESVELAMNNIIAESLGDAGYGKVHVFSLEPLSFTTSFSRDRIQGEWWQ